MEEVHRSGSAALTRAAVLLALGVAACTSPARERDPWPGSGATAADTVGWLDGSAVTYGDVARYLRTKDPEAFTRSLEGLVLERVTRAEAEALGVDLPAAVRRRRTGQRLAEWRRRVRAASKEASGEEVDPALWLQRVAGVSLERFRAWVERHTETELLQDRLSRYELLTTRRVEVSLIVVADAATAERLARDARQGADFADLARRHSVHASRGDGGRIPYPLLPLDVNDPEVREALFAARKGAILGPFRTRGGKSVYYQIYRVESVREAARGDYAALESEVVRDLAARPVHVGEYERWRRRILLRHGFDAAHAAGENG